MLHQKGTFSLVGLRLHFKDKTASYANRFGGHLFPSERECSLKVDRTLTTRLWRFIIASRTVRQQKFNSLNFKRVKLKYIYFYIKTIGKIE